MKTRLCLFHEYKNKRIQPQTVNPATSRRIPQFHKTNNKITKIGKKQHHVIKQAVAAVLINATNANN